MGGGDIFKIGVRDCEVIYGLIHKVIVSEDENSLLGGRGLSN